MRKIILKFILVYVDCEALSRSLRETEFHSKDQRCIFHDIVTVVEGFQKKSSSRVKMLILKWQENGLAIP